MAAIDTKYEHIVLSNDNVPMISGTNMKVIELVLEHKAYGWSPEELYFQHSYLTLGKIYSALAYYWDHHEEIDKDIENALERVNQIEEIQKRPTKLEKRLKDKGLL